MATPLDSMPEGAAGAAGASSSSFNVGSSAELAMDEGGMAGSWYAVTVLELLGNGEVLLRVAGLHDAAEPDGDLLMGREAPLVILREALQQEPLQGALL